MTTKFRKVLTVLSLTATLMGAFTFLGSPQSASASHTTQPTTTIMWGQLVDVQGRGVAGVYVYVMDASTTATRQVDLVLTNSQGVFVSSKWLPINRPYELNFFQHRTAAGRYVLNPIVVKPQWRYSHRNVFTQWQFSSSTFTVGGGGQANYDCIAERHCQWWGQGANYYSNVGKYTMGWQP